MDVSLIQKALAHPLDRSDFPRLGKKYEGKVRDNYSTADGRRVIVVTDRISAFDRVLGTLPLKGQVLNHAAAFWFASTAHIVPNHVLSVPDPNVLIAKECTPLPVEMVVRAYLTGSTSTSIWVHYERGAREFCGHRLPEGLKKHAKLPEPLLTPSTKAPKGDHDISASRGEILQISGMPAADFDAAAAMAMALFKEGQRLCASRGLILVDTKYEFGKNSRRRDRRDRRDPHPRIRPDFGTRPAMSHASKPAKIPRASTKNTCGATWSTKITAAKARSQ